MGDYRSNQDWIRAFGMVAILASEIAVTTLSGFLIGYLVRGRWGFGEWPIFVGALFGFTASLYFVYRIARTQRTNDDKSGSKD